ncbi:MAG: hypothetical protein KGH53_01955 [Candidatus Micrarchaeota archaeon]|nr:hypothetical protein [Candidatus Micrarchaeota archaeon]
MSEEDDLGNALKLSSKKRRAPSIAVPMTIWIILLLIALLLNAFAVWNASAPGQAGINSVLLAISNFILNLPGIVIMPIVFGAAIGAIAGLKGRTMQDGAQLGAIDGVYASVIYVVAIVVIYLIMVYTLPASAPTIYNLGAYWLALPVFLAILLAVIFGALTSLRK